MKNYVRYDVSRNNVITIGVHENNHIRLNYPNGNKASVLIICKKQRWHIIPAPAFKVICNNKMINNIIPLTNGDYVQVEKISIIIQKDYFDIKLPERTTTTLKSFANASFLYDENYPNYHRSPRIIYFVEQLSISIDDPMNVPSKPINELWRIVITPISTILITIIMGIATSRGWVTYLGVITTLVTSIISFITFIRKNIKYKKEVSAIKGNYIKYLITKSKQIKAQIDYQRQSLNYHLPQIVEIRNLIEIMSHRIYERTPAHSDFLEYQIGKVKMEFALEIKATLNELDNKKDIFKQLVSNIKQEYDVEEHLPYAIKIDKSAIGYIGMRNPIIEQLQLMILQLSVFHSYHDLRFILIFPEAEKREWEFTRWLPHMKLPSTNLRSFIYNIKSRDHVLSRLYQIFKERKQQFLVSKKLFFPRYVIIITYFELIRDHNIMEFITSECNNFGITLLYVSDDMECLPEFVETIIQIKNDNNGVLLLENNCYQKREVLLEYFPSNFEKEQITRALAALNHQLEFTNMIPKSITFLETYNVESIEELRVLDRWNINTPYKSLAVPIGCRGKHDIVYLNLHERAHGPHGLIAGTTGSGKSEIIQSLILSLAINFHPYNVAFLLIDYKGGGMANLFKALPHLLGSITNLDGSQSMRALISIKSELQKRQKLFNDCDVNHINQYQKLYKKGIVLEAMPHLFLITDEFAELKMEQPEFMKELVSIARIGRSLGIHLILATQKPTGIVDEQIWSNSTFKLCLKVQDVADSNEILKTADAANITIPGRAYLQVGNNEIYELFQSAWSGADYNFDVEKKDKLDETIYWINDFGKYEVMSEDLSDLDNNIHKEKTQTELEVITKYLEKLAESSQIKKLSRPWLPPLTTRLAVRKKNFIKSWLVKKLPLRFEIGILDQPHIQAQSPLIIDLTQDGHVLVISSPGYGKSTTMQTCVMQLCRSFHPEQLHIYLIDFGTNGLLPLKDLPHIADIIRIDENEKISKFIQRIMLEINERKRLLSEYSVSSLVQYENLSKCVLPNILIAIDNMDALKEMDTSIAFEQNLNQIAREGATLGIHLILSATRESSLRLQLLSNIKIRLIQYMIEPAIITALVGRSSIAIEAYAGRGLIKLEEPTLFQIGIPARGKNSLEVMSNMKEEIFEMNRLFNGQKPFSIPMMPKNLTGVYFNQLESVKQTQQINHLIPIGIEYEFVGVVSYNLTEEVAIVMTDSILKTDNFVTHILIQISQKNFSNVFLLGNSKAVNEFPFLQKVKINEIAHIIKNILKRIEKRKNIMGDSAEYYLITDLISVFQKMSEPLQNQLIQVIEESIKYNIYFIIIGEYPIINNSYLLKQMIRTKETIILFMKMSEQSIISIEERIYNEPRLLTEDGYLIKHGYATKFKIPTIN